MGRKINFTIAGEPVAQGRPRFSNRGGFVRAYDPAKSREAKQHVRSAAGEAMKILDGKMLEGPLVFKAQFGLVLPKSQWRKRTPVPMRWREKKPDLDNLIKTCTDAMEGIVYQNDSQLVRYVCEKVTVAQGDAPFTKIMIEEAEDRSLSSD